jgi:hypothetical protein
MHVGEFRDVEDWWRMLLLLELKLENDKERIFSVATVFEV